MRNELMGFSAEKTLGAAAFIYAGKSGNSVRHTPGLSFQTGERPTYCVKQVGSCMSASVCVDKLIGDKCWGEKKCHAVDPVKYCNGENCCCGCS